MCFNQSTFLHCQSSEKRRALDTHALGGGTVSDQGGPNIAGTNGPGGPLIAGDHKFRDRPLTIVSQHYSVMVFHHTLYQLSNHGIFSKPIVIIVVLFHFGRFHNYSLVHRYHW